MTGKIELRVLDDFSVEVECDMKDFGGVFDHAVVISALMQALSIDTQDVDKVATLMTVVRALNRNSTKINMTELAKLKRKKGEQ